MRQLAVVGATSRLGEVIVNRALSAGFGVHAFGRHLERLAQRFNENLSAFDGDPLTGRGLEPAVKGCRFVVCAVEVEKPGIALLLSHLLPLLKVPPLGRFVFVSQWRSSAPPAGLLQRFSAWRGRASREDLERAEALLRASKLPWVILRPSGYAGASAPREVVATGTSDAAPAPVGRGALAKFIMELLQEPGWDHREVSVGAPLGQPGAAVLKHTRLTTVPGVQVSTLVDPERLAAARAAVERAGTPDSSVLGAPTVPAEQPAEPASAASEAPPEPKPEPGPGSGEPGG